MSRLRFALLALLYAVFMLYGSTVVSPTGFSPNGLSVDQAIEILRHVHFIQNGSDQRADWMANLIAMIPLGFLIAGAMQQRHAGLPERIAVALGAFTLSVGYVLGVKFAQVFFPRTVTLNYIAAQSIGATCGVALCVLGRDRIGATLQQLAAPGTAALSVLLGLYSLALASFMLVPFDIVLSADDAAWRLSTLRAHLFEIPGTGRSTVIRLVLMAMAVAAAIPVGMWLGLRRRAAAAIGLGVLAVLAVTVASMAMLSASTNLVNLPLRLAGVMIGVGVVQLLQRHDIERFRPALAKLALWLVLPYLALLFSVNGLVSSHWRSLADAMAAVDQRFYIPLWTHYIVTKAQAARSVAAQMAMYAPLGVFIWLRGGRGQGGAWLAALLAALLSAGVELARWLKPGFLLDINNPAIAGVAAGAAVLLMPLLWRALRSVGRDLPPELPQARVAPREPGGGPIGAMLLMAAMALDGWALWQYPLPAWPLATALVAYAMLLWRWPQAWLVVIPVVLPALDLAPWSGWMLVGESDLFVLATLGVLAWRTPLAWADVRLPRGTAIVAALFLTSVVISLARGLLLPGPQAGSSDIYMLPLNAWRLAKPLGTALLLLAFAAQRQRRHGDALPLFAWGVTLGVCVVAVEVGLERMAFVSLFDFSTDYRVVGPFSSMHIGGGHIGAYLAMAVPFALVCLVRWRWWSLPTLAVITLLSVATLIVTYARTAYVAALLALCATALGLALSGRRRGVAWLGLVLVLLPTGLGLGWAATHSELMSGRLRTISQDLTMRLDNWSYGARLQGDSLATRLFGMGIGSYPRLSLAATGPLAGPGDFALSQQDGRSVLTLRSRDLLYFGQKVRAVHGESYTLSLLARSPQGGSLSVALCEKLLLYSMRCGGKVFPLAPGSAWTRLSAVVRLGDDPPAPTLAWPRRPVDFSLFGTPGSAIHITGLHLTDANGGEMLANGGFTDGLARWFFTADDHLSWRIKDQYLMTLFDNGVLGLLALAALMAACVANILRALARGDAMAAVLLGSITAICASSLFDAVLEAPRLATMIALVAGMALITGRQRNADVTSTR